MKRRIIALALLLSILLGLCACSKESSFSIRFIDVGQGDSALVECDGHYMLIDGGSMAKGKAVYEALRKQKVRKLDILAISHLHEDHYGGLVKALDWPSKVKMTICNAQKPIDQKDKGHAATFDKLEKKLKEVGTRITIPSDGQEYQLGSAVVEVVDATAERNNDSLVLLVTYGKNRFLFTGDIEESAQRRIVKKYQREPVDLEETLFKIDLMKMPHHGAYVTSLYDFMRAFKPDYVIISVGTPNGHKHPDEETLDMLNKTWKPHLFRTDLNGDIIVRSNGEEIEVTASK